MMKIKLIASYDNGFEHPEDSRVVKTITHEFDGVMLLDMLEEFEHFLKGIGFVFDGTVDLVEEEVAPEPETEAVDDKLKRNRKGRK